MNAIQGVYRTNGLASRPGGRWIALAAVSLGVVVLLKWGIWDAIFSPARSDACRSAAGACWAVITTQWKLILLGTYPFEEIWRPLIAIGLLIGTFVSAFIRPRLGIIVVIWTLGTLASVALLDGRPLGLRRVETLQWGGLPLTLLLTQAIMLLSFPLALLVALMRRSESVLLRSLALVSVECVRGVPLVSLLFFATLVIPLFLSRLSNLDKLLAASLAIVVFNAAYISEVIRGGLMTVPAGQFEAAKALGFRWISTHRLIVLPQALRACAPSLVNHAVGIVKDTSLVAVVGIFDLMNSAKLSLADVRWRENYIEVYMLVGVSYFVLCTSIAFLGRKLYSRYFLA